MLVPRHWMRDQFLFAAVENPFRPSLTYARGLGRTVHRD